MKSEKNARHLIASCWRSRSLTADPEAFRNTCFSLRSSFSLFLVLLSSCSLHASPPATPQVLSLRHAFPDDLVLDPGSRVSLKCEAFGSPLLPQVTWTLDGEPIIESDGHGSRIRVGDYVTTGSSSVHSFVNISSIRLEDGGVYACTASAAMQSSSLSAQSSHLSGRTTAGTLDVEPLVYAARVTVKGKPFIKSFARNRTIISGSTLVIDCPFTGTISGSSAAVSLPLISWSKGSPATPVISLPHNHRQVLHSNGSRLVVHKMDRAADQDLYTCSLASISASSSSSVFVQVLLPPLISPFVSASNLREGMRSTLTCSALEGDPPLDFQWFKDGELVVPSSGRAIIPDGGGIERRMIVSSSNDYSSTLSFPSVAFHDNGNWTCVVRNPVATANHTVSMIVKGEHSISFYASFRLF